MSEKLTISEEYISPEIEFARQQSKIYEDAYQEIMDSIEYAKPSLEEKIETILNEKKYSNEQELIKMILKQIDDKELYKVLEELYDKK